MSGIDETDERAWAADKRDFVAHCRDDIAAEREALADAREATADERDRLADEREARLVEWERRLDDRAAELGLPPRRMHDEREAARRDATKTAWPVTRHCRNVSDAQPP